MRTHLKGLVLLCVVAPLETPYLIWRGWLCITGQLENDVREEVDPDLVPPLTAREFEVLERLAHLWTTEEIAGDLIVSANTVRTHIRAILTKYRVASRAGAIRAAWRDGTLPEPLWIKEPHDEEAPHHPGGPAPAVCQ